MLKILNGWVLQQKNCKDCKQFVGCSIKSKFISWIILSNSHIILKIVKKALKLSQLKTLLIETEVQKLKCKKPKQIGSHFEWNNTSQRENRKMYNTNLNTMPKSKKSSYFFIYIISFKKFLLKKSIRYLVHWDNMVYFWGLISIFDAYMNPAGS